MSSFEFSEFVKQRAAELGLNMTELARRSGVSRQGLYALLDGSSGQARIATLVGLAVTLRVHPFQMFRCFSGNFSLPHSFSPAAKYACDASGFIRDVTIPDNSVVFVNQVFVKQWEIQNIGGVDWTGRKLKCMDPFYESVEMSEQAGAAFFQRLLRSTQRVIDIPDTAAGQSVILEVEFTAPCYPCCVVSYWKMLDACGNLCFPKTEGLYCMVQVVAV